MIAALNAILPPIIAAIRLPLTLVFGFLSILVLDALMLLAADSLTDGRMSVDGFWWALLVAFLASAVTLVLEVVAGVDDDSEFSFRVVQRIARRTGTPVRTDAPGIVFLEIDGLALPVLRRAMRDGNAPQMASWLTEDGYALSGWETDLSSQTGASQAGILLGSNVDIPAFRWVEKETATVMTCSAPADCAELERRHATDKGLLLDGGASRGNLLSGQADAVILTVSRIEAEKRANPGYRTFFANGFNVMRVLVLFVWEVLLEWTSALRASRRDVRPRGHRGGVYPFMRAAMCVVVRDLIVQSVLTDMMSRAARGVRDVLELRRGRPPLRARARRHARGAAQARPPVRPDRAGRAATRRGRTRSSSSPTTARRRAQPSSSETATGSTSSSSARSSRPTSTSLVER